MAKSLLLRVLQDYFGRYIDGLSSENLKVAVWQGEINLENLDLKREILDTASLYVPLQFKCGRIRKFHVSVPWSQLGSQPVKVVIDGLYLLASITEDDEDNGDTDSSSGQAPTPSLSSAARKIIAEKRFKLRWAELLGESSGSASPSTASGEDSESFFTRLGGKIMENLQVTVKSAHIRFDDAGLSTNPSNPEQLSLGITVGELCMQSCDENGVIRFIDEKPGAVSFKIFKIEHLAMYVDVTPKWPESAAVEDVVNRMRDVEEAVSSRDLSKSPKLVLEPCVITFLMSKNDSPGSRMDTPRFSFALNMNTLKLVAEKSQYLAVYHLYKAVQRYWLFAEFRQHRPAESVVESPRKWWRYALDCLKMKRDKEFATESLEEYRKEQLKDWKVLVSLVVDHNRYVRLFKIKHGKPGKWTDGLKDELQRLEDKLEVDHTLHFRSLALAELSLEQRRLREESSWLSSWFADDSIRISEQDREEILNAMDLTASSSMKHLRLPEGAVYSRFTVTVGKGSIRLVAGGAGEICRMELGGEQELEWLVGKSWRLSARMHKFVLTHGEPSTIGQRFPRICDFSGQSPLSPRNHHQHHHQRTSSTGSGSERRGSLLLDLVCKDVGKEADCAVSIAAEFRNHEDISRQMVRVNVSTMPCVVVVLPTFFASVAAFFSLRVLKESAAGAIGAMSQTAVADVKEKRRFHIDLEIAAPVVAFPVVEPEPQGKQETPVQVLVLDFGFLTARREDLDAMMSLSQSRSMDVDHDGDGDGDVFYSAMEQEEIYSHEWFLKISSMQVLLCEYSCSCSAGQGEEQGRAEEILRKFDLNLHVERTKTAAESSLVMAFTLNHMQWTLLPRLLLCLEALSHDLRLHSPLAQAEGDQTDEEVHLARPAAAPFTLRVSFIIGEVNVGVVQDDGDCIACSSLQGIHGSVEADDRSSSFEVELTSFLLQDADATKTLAQSTAKRGEPLIKLSVKQELQHIGYVFAFNALHVEWDHRSFIAFATHFHWQQPYPLEPSVQPLALAKPNPKAAVAVETRRRSLTARLGSFSTALNLPGGMGCAGVLCIRDLVINVEEVDGHKKTTGELGNLSVVRGDTELFTVASKTDALIRVSVVHGAQPVYRLTLSPSRLVYVQPIVDDILCFADALNLPLSSSPALLQDTPKTHPVSFYVTIDRLEIRLPASCDPLDSSFISLTCKQFEAESKPAEAESVLGNKRTTVSMEDLDLSTSNTVSGRKSLLESPVRCDISIEHRGSSSPNSVEDTVNARVSDVCIQLGERQYWLILAALTDNLMQDSTAWTPAVPTQPQQPHVEAPQGTFDVVIHCGLASLSLVEKKQGLAVFAMQGCRVVLARPSADDAVSTVLKVEGLKLYDRRPKSAQHWFQHLIITEPARQDGQPAFEVRFEYATRHVEIDLVGFTSVVQWSLLTNIVNFITTVQDPQEEQALLALRRWKKKAEPVVTETGIEWTGAFRLIQPRLYFVQDFAGQSSNMIVVSGDISLKWTSTPMRAVWNGEVSQLQAYVACSLVQDKQIDILGKVEADDPLIEEFVQHQLIEPTQFSFEYESAYMDVYSLVQSDRVDMRLTQCEIYLSMNDLLLIGDVLRAFESEAEPDVVKPKPRRAMIKRQPSGATVDTTSSDEETTNPTSEILRDDDDVLEFTVHKGAVGLSLRSEHGFIVVDAVATEGVALECGVARDDVVMQVGKEVVVESSVAQVEALLETSKRPLKVLVQKRDSLLPVVFKRTVSIKLRKVVVNLVDDLEDGDLPLSNFVLSDLDAFVNGSSVGTFVGGFLVNVTAAHYFDHTLGRWGMLMTPATVNVTSTWYNNGDVDLQIDMPDPIQFFLSERFLRVLYTAINAIQAVPITAAKRQEMMLRLRERSNRKLAPVTLNYAHVVHNLTGFNLRFAKKDEAYVELANGESATFGVEYHSGAGTGKVRGYSHRCSLSIEVTALDGSIYIGRTEVNVQQTSEGLLELERASDQALIQVKYEVYIEDASRRLALTLRSLIQVTNRLKYPLAVLANGLGWSTAKLAPWLVQPGDARFLPVWFNELSELRVRPVFGDAQSTFEWSTPCYKSMAQLTEEGQENTCPLECSASHAPNRYFNCTILMREDGVTVGFSFIPSVTLHNMLPVPLLYQEAAPEVSDALPIAMGSVDPGDQDQLTRLSLTSPQNNLLSFSIQGSEWTQRIRLKPPKRRKRSGRGKMATTKQQTEPDVQAHRDEQIADFKLKTGSGQSVLCHLVYTREELGITNAVVYVQYWVLNRTLLPMHIEGSVVKVPNASLYMYSTSAKTKGKLRFGLVEPIVATLPLHEISTPGVSRKTRIVASEKIYDVGVSIDVAPGSLYRTSIVTVAPSYVIVNNSTWTINIRQALAKDYVSVFPPSTNHPYWSAPVPMEHPYEVQVAFTFAANEQTIGTEWSKPFVIDDYTKAEGTVHIALKRMRESTVTEYFSLEAHASSEVSSTLVKICDSTAADSLFLTNIKQIHPNGAAAAAAAERSVIVKISSICLDISQDSARTIPDPKPIARFQVSGVQCELSPGEVEFRCKAVQLADLREAASFSEVFTCRPRGKGEGKAHGIDVRVKSSEVLSSSPVQLFDLLEVDVLPITLNVDEAFIVDSLKLYQRVTFIDVVKQRRDTAKTTKSVRRSLKKKSVSFDTLGTIQSFINFSKSASLVSAMDLSSDHKPMYFDRLFISRLKVVVSLQQDPARNEANRLYDLGGGWLSRMNIRVDGAVLSFDQLASEGLFGSRNMFLSKAKLHYIDQVKSQMTSFYTKVNPWATNWGIAATVQGRIYGEKVDSSEFPGRKLRTSEIVPEYKQRVQGCGSVDDAVTMLRQLVFDWRFNHRGINAQRCVVLGVINLSTMDIEIQKPVLKSQNRFGSKLHDLSGRLKLKRFDEALTADNVVALMGCGSRLKEVVKIEFLCSAFYGLFGSDSILKPTQAASVNYIHKRDDEWHSLYILVINEKIK